MANCGGRFGWREGLDGMCCCTFIPAILHGFLCEVGTAGEGLALKDGRGNEGVSRLDAGIQYYEQVCVWFRAAHGVRVRALGGLRVSRGC